MIKRYTVKVQINKETMICEIDAFSISHAREKIIKQYGLFNRVKILEVK